ncbi:hypothetical protein ABIB26_000019 [Arthrobacter sp. UYEF20]
MGTPVKDCRLSRLDRAGSAGPFDETGGLNREKTSRELMLPGGLPVVQPLLWRRIDH